MRRKGMGAASRKRRRLRVVGRRRRVSLEDFAAGLLAASGADSVSLSELDDAGRRVEVCRVDRPAA